MSDPIEYKNIIYNYDYLGDVVNPHLANNKFYFSFSQTSGSSIRYTAIYDLSEQVVKVFNSFKKYSPKNPSGLPFENITFTELIGSDEDVLIYSINPNNLSDNEFSLIKNNVANSLDRESNPILFFVKDN